MFMQIFQCPSLSCSPFERGSRQYIGMSAFLFPECFSSQGSMFTCSKVLFHGSESIPCAVLVLTRFVSSWNAFSYFPFFCTLSLLVAQDCYNPRDRWVPGEKAWRCECALHCPPDVGLPGRGHSSRGPKGKIPIVPQIKIFIKAIEQHKEGGIINNFFLKKNKP